MIETQDSEGGNKLVGHVRLDYGDEQQSEERSEEYSEERSEERSEEKNELLMIVLVGVIALGVMVASLLTILSGVFAS
jgi:hypothetical protein